MSNIEHLINKAMTSDSEDEAIAAFKMARKKNAGRNWTSGAKPPPINDDYEKELQRTQAALQKLKDDYGLLSHLYRVEQSNARAIYMSSSALQEHRGVLKSRRRWMIWGWLNAGVYLVAMFADRGFF